MSDHPPRRAMSDRIEPPDMFARITAAEGVSTPRGWIQWKGTGVCIDLHCTCGHMGHVDGDFFYAYRCPKCRVAYHVGANVHLVPMTPEEEAWMEGAACGITESTEDGT